MDRQVTAQRGHDSVQNRTSRVRTRPPFECVALLLQGGGALGAYQAGVYQGLPEADRATHRR
jgi:NTE family protein